jgi:hypothetical protein
MLPDTQNALDFTQQRAAGFAIDGSEIYLEQMSYIAGRGASNGGDVVFLASVGDLDILTSFPDRDGRRLTYHDVVISAAPGDLEGIAVRIAALDDVIASKEWANRPKDHEALPELRAIRDRSREPRREAEIDPHTRRTTPRDPGLER